MFGKSSLLSLSVSALLATRALAALDPIVIKGSKFFFKSNGTQFFIKGVAYQAGISSNGSTTSNGKYTDPLADTATCTRDIPYLVRLGANTIRTYAIDPTQDHTTCMNLLADAGIYVVSDLGEPSTSINRADPQWNTDLYKRYTSVIDTLAPFTNTIGFFAGNEVSNNVTYTGASAFVKAAVRDSKAYIASKGYRAIGVGYAADDDATVRENIAAYFNCGNAADQIDFWGYNIYEWCGDSSYTTSGYDQRVAEFSKYSVPTFFAEYGCNTPGGAAGRKFTEVKALYGSDMTPVFSGGIVYEYFQEENDYGLVSIDSSNAVSTLADFAAFSTQIHAATPTGVNAASYSPTNTAVSECPSVNTEWLAASDPLPPSPNSTVCACKVSSLSCVASSTLSDKEIGTLFGQVCGYDSGKACDSISRDAKNGKYGAYSMCDSTQQLAIAFDAYYQSQNKASTACNFGGGASVVSAKADSSCSAVLKSAGAAASGGGSGAGGAATSTKNPNGAGGLSPVDATLGKVWMVGFAVLAGLSGVGMIVL